MTPVAPLAVPAGATWGELARAARGAQQAHDGAGVKAALLAMRAKAPNNLDVTLALAQADLGRGDVAGAVGWLDVYASAGLVVELAKDAELAPLAKEPRAAAVRAKLEANARPVAKGGVAFALPTGDLLLEDVAWDADARVFYVSSVRGRKVIAVDTKGAARDVTAPEVEGIGVLGVALDRARHVLWVAEAPLPQVPGYHKGDDANVASSVVALDPKSGKAIERIALPVDGARHALTDLAVTHDGDVIASDARGGVVYVVRAGTHRLEPLAAGFRSPQTPAPRADGRVYVPDYALGVALVDVKTGATSWVTAPPDVALAGIDGLYLAGDSLVAMQNGTTPPRVVRFRLDPSGARVVSAEVLVAGAPGLGEPTHGAIVDGELWFLASSGWSRFDDDGALVAAPPPDAPAFWRAKM